MRFNKYIFASAGLILAIVIITFVYFRSNSGVFHRQYFGKWQYQGVNRVSGLTASLVYSSGKIQVNVASDKKNTVDFSMSFPKAVMSAEKNRIVYSTDNGRKKIIYSLNDRGVKEEIILESNKDLEKEYIYEINSPGLIPVQNTAGDWFFYSETDKNFVNPVFKIPKPFMIDKNGEKSDLIEAKFESKNNRQIFKLSPDIDWLTSKLRKYPVIIDPTIENPDNPVAYWKFDEGYGTTTMDGSVNKFAGTLSGSTIPRWQQEDICLSGKCLYYDGLTSYVSITDPGTASNLDFAGGDSVTIEAWINPNSLPSGKTAVIITKGATTTQNSRNYQLGFDENGTIYFFKSGVSCFGGWAAITTATAPIIVNTWQHITLSYTFGTSSSIKMYYNGKLQTLTSWVGDAIDETCVQNDPLWIGSDYNNTNSFQGKIDDIKIYRYIRSADQIKADYNSGRSRLSNNKGTSAVLGGVNPNIVGPIPNGLVGYWKMDEASGNTLDSSGNLNTGIPTGTTVVSGKYGNGRSFNGTTDLINAASGTSIDDLTQLTVSAWIKLTAFGGSSLGRIADKGISAGATYGWGFFVCNDVTHCTNSLGLYRNFDQSDGWWTSANNSISTGVWTHVVVTYDKSSPNNAPKFYINGVQSVTTASLSPLGTARSDAVYDLFIGNRSGADRGFNGQIDDVRIFNRILTPAEVTQLFNWAPGPVGYWNYENESGNVVIDRSGNGNDGQLINSGYISGIYGKAMMTKNNGLQDETVITDPASGLLDFSGTQSFTYGAWIKTTLLGNTVYLVTKNINGNPSMAGYSIAASHAGGAASVSCDYSDGTGGGNGWDSATLSASSLEDGKWHYISCVMDRLGIVMSSPGLFLFYDGELQAADMSLTAGSSANSGNLEFGEGTSNSDDIVNGGVDEVRIYNYARTQKQIIEDMNAGHPTPGSPVGSALAWWKFDEGVGNIIKDSGYGNNSGIWTTPSWFKEGRYGGAGNFSGNNGPYITLNTTDKYDLLTEGTITAWVKLSPSASNNYNQIFVADSGNCVNPFEFAVRKTSATTAQFEIWANANGCSGAFNAYVPLTNIYDWHHLAFTSDSTGNRFYVDGIRKTPQYVSGNSSTSYFLNTTSANTTLYSIGSVVVGNLETFYGLIDEVKIYSSALTDDQLKMEYNKAQSIVLGAVSNTSVLTGGKIASNSAIAQYCVPGDNNLCNQPVAEWKFEEGTGLILNDTSGNDYSGTWTGNGNYWTQGKFGKAGNFNGLNNVITIDPQVRALNGKAGMTISAWVKPSFASNATSRPLRYIYRTGSWGPNIWFNNDNNQYAITCQMWNSNANDISVTTNSLGKPNWIANTWHYVTCLFNGSSSKIYWDGQEIISANGYSGVLHDNSDVSSNISANSYEWLGAIDELKIFNYARTPAQIAWDYNRGEPTGYWKFNECQGTVFHDSSGNQLEGTWQGGTSIGNCSTSSTAWGNGALGKYNSSINFNGSNDYIDLGNKTILDGLSEASICFWMKYIPTSVTVDGVIVSRYNNTTNGWLIWVDDVATYNGNIDTMSWAPDPSSADGRVEGTSGLITTGVWDHYCGTFKGGQFIRLYKNGKLNAEKSTTKTVVSTESVNDYIGRSNDGRYLNANIDDLKLWNYALTQSQVTADFNQGSAVRFGPITGTP